MKRDDDSLIYPPQEALLEKIPQKYELVLTATRRAKQILRENRLQALVDDGPQRKPLSVALEDIVEGKVDREALMQPDLELDDFLGDDDAFSEFEMLDDEPRDTDDVADDSKRDTSESDYIEDDDMDDIDFDVDFKLLDEGPEGD